MHEDAIGSKNFDTEPDGTTVIKKQNKGSVLPWAGEYIPEYILKTLATDDIMTVAQFFIQMVTENERDLKSVIKRGSGDADIQESGVAKMVDREPLEAGLIALAEDCEIYSSKVNDIVAKLLNQENDCSFEFDKDFDFRSLEQKFIEIEKAQTIGIAKMSPTLRKEMWKNTVGEITRDVETQDICIEEIDSAPDEDEALEESVNKIVDGQFSRQFKDNSSGTTE